jgi:hypothetical protein
MLTSPSGEVKSLTLKCGCNRNYLRACYCSFFFNFQYLESNTFESFQEIQSFRDVFMLYKRDYVRPSQSILLALSVRLYPYCLVRQRPVCRSRNFPAVYATRNRVLVVPPLGPTCAI